ncbi:MAG TPA: dienelactone hydrolase family protein [Allosphingosinicella sp.]
MTRELRDRAIALYDRFTHETLDRRAFMAELTRIAGSAAAANALLISVSACSTAPAVVPEGAAGLVTGDVEWETAPGRRMRGYSAAPARWRSGGPAVIVIHENRGLNEHIRDVARRAALAGYRAVAPDFLAPAGGTPADEDRARTLIGGLNLGASVGDAVATAAWLRSRAGGRHRKVGAIGFCWGGAMVNRLAAAAGAGLDAGVPFYGPAPDPAQAAQVRAALLVVLAGRDERVNRTALPWVEALRTAGKRVESITFPEADHAFHNDTSAARYNEPAARQAWAAALAFLAQHLR